MKKYLLSLLAGLSLATTTYASNLETLLLQSQARQQKIEQEQELRRFPFYPAKKLNYRLVGNCDIPILNAIKRYGQGSLTTTFQGNIVTFSLENLISGNKTKQTSVIKLPEFQTLEYLYDKTNLATNQTKHQTTSTRRNNPETNSEEDLEPNRELNLETLIDEVSVIQFVRTLDFQKQREYKIKALGISNTEKGKIYEITIKYLGKSHSKIPLETPSGNYKDLLNVQLTLHKENESTINIYYTNDKQRVPVYIRGKKGIIVGKCYLKDIELLKE